MPRNADDAPPPSPAREGRASRQPDVTVSLRASSQGGFLYTYSGKAHQGESGTEDIARSIVAFLNGMGEEWSAPKRPPGKETGIDFEAVGPRGTLRMQITRVPQDSQYFHEVADAGHIERRSSPQELAEELIQAIRRKAAKIPPPLRPEITLVLDGSRHLGFDFGATARAFYECYHSEALGLGFEDILLLGTMRLLAMLSPPPENDWWFPGAERAVPATSE